MPLNRQASWLFLLLLILPASWAAGIQPPLIEPEIGSSYFTRYNFKEEKDRHNATNYWRGNLIPVNSRVTLVSLGKKKMRIKLDSGRTITVLNKAKYTKRSMAQIASNLLSPKPLKLGSLSKQAQAAIAAGEMQLGLTRDLVLITRGYPPQHKTPSLDNNTWTYWSSKFVKRSVVFENGVLARGRGLR